jgi:DNA repair exonuclease SbcCD ATPase subunit
MAILFKKLRWKNFLSTGNVFTEIDLASKDTTLIVGINGAGKSTILDALTFGLFGKPFRKINKPQLVNSITQKNCLVEVEFNIGSNRYKILRGIKPTVFEVYMNDKLLNQSAEMKDYQEILEKQIIKVNQKSFSQVVILGSATFQPFMQLPGGQRREIIEDLLDLQIFTVMNSLLKDKILANSGDITTTLNDKKIIESKIELTKQHMQQVSDSTINTIKEKETLIIQTENQIKELAKKVNNVDKQIEKLQKEIVDEDAVSKKINKISKLQNQIEAKISILQSDLEFFENNDNCPTCKQNIVEEFRNKSIEEKNSQIKETQDGLKLLAVEYDTVNNRFNQIVNFISHIRNLELQQIEYKTNIKSLQKYNDSLLKEIETLKENTELVKDDKIVQFEIELKDIEYRYNGCIEERNILTATSMLLKDTGIKSKIIKQYIPVINKLINKYLSAMDFFVSFELDEQFNETIKSRYRDDFTYASFSEGEKQKIDLALLFTWRAIAKLRNSINTNLLIMDEVFDSSLDINAVDYLMNIIRDVSKDSNIIVISHKEHLNEKFNNVLKFIKNKNFSQIQE